MNDVLSLSGLQTDFLAGKILPSDLHRSGWTTISQTLPVGLRLPVHTLSAVVASAVAVAAAAANLVVVAIAAHANV
jgi:hypothetical protein